VTYKEHVVRGSVRSEHLVQLFDTSESLADTLAAFVCDGLQQGATILIVCTQAHWSLAAERVAAHGCAVDEPTRTGRLTVLDAAATLKQFMRHSGPDTRLFEETVGSLVRTLSGRGPRLWIYGEMVDLLASEGDYRGALRLEELWNALGEKESYTLFCGYHAVNFGDPRTGNALKGICRAHSGVHVNPIDRLGAWLLASNTADVQPPLRSLSDPV
jgi:hypothetical protein